MTVFVKRYPSKGEFPEKSGWYLGSGAVHQYSVDNGFYDTVKWWLEEIELPSEEDVRREALGPFKEKHLDGQYGDFIQDDINTFTKGANYILNLLKQKKNGNTIT